MMNGQEASVVIDTQAYKEFEIFLHRQYIKQALSKAKEEARNPDTKWLREDEFWADFEANL